MNVRIEETEALALAGMSYYGPLTGEGWSRENPIGQLWQRFNRFFDENPAFAQEQAVKPGIGYEISVWNEDELRESQSFYVFVGVEVRKLDALPLQLVSRVLPASAYAHLTPRGREITTWERTFYDEWLPRSEFRLQAHSDYHFQIQAYEEGRFKGLGDLLEESEIDVYIPIERAVQDTGMIEEEEMEPRIVSLPAFTVVGVKYHGRNENNEIKQMWDDFGPHMHEIKHTVHKHDCYGISANVDEETHEFDYFAGFEVDSTADIPEGMVSFEVPEATYAVFATTLPGIGQTFDHAYCTWLPKSGHQRTGGPDLELYDERFDPADPASTFDLYIPIK